MNSQVLHVVRNTGTPVRNGLYTSLKSLLLKEFSTFKPEHWGNLPRITRLAEGPTGLRRSRCGGPFLVPVCRPGPSRPRHSSVRSPVAGIGLRALREGSDLARLRVVPTFVDKGDRPAATDLVPAPSGMQRETAYYQLSFPRLCTFLSFSKTSCRAVPLC